MLCLEIEYLLGVSFASLGRIKPEPDFPPQPDRIFSALVSSWGARGKQPEERAALEWLETQAVPEIAHGDYWPRGRAAVYVPPNIDRAGKNQGKLVQLLPARRARQVRAFPAVRLDDDRTRVTLIWAESEPEASIFAALQALAVDTSYIGHSSSLTRLAFRRDVLPSKDVRESARRRIFRGRLEQLEATFARECETGRKDGPEAGAPVVTVPRTEPAAQVPTSTFSSDWLVLELLDRRERALDVRTAAVAAKAIRDTIMGGYRLIGLGDAIPEVVSGHRVDGKPSAAPHLAVVPMSFVGRPHADGRLFGFALVPPRACALLDNADSYKAILKVSRFDEAEEQRVLKVQPSGGAWSTELGFIDGAAPRASLRPEPYIGPACCWATATPIVLDRHLKSHKRSSTRGDNAALQGEIEGQIAEAVTRIGLPRPTQVCAAKHSALQGAPSARPSGSAPSWTAWQVPTSLASRTLVHATLTFASAVQGPMILGAGRYVGLGLCRPLADGGTRA